jgi:hypothetical protein
MERHKLSGDQAENTEALYQGKRLEDDSHDATLLEKRSGSKNNPRPHFGLAIGDARHRQFVAELYADSSHD